MLEQISSIFHHGNSSHGFSMIKRMNASFHEHFNLIVLSFFCSLSKQVFFSRLNVCYSFVLIIKQCKFRCVKLRSYRYWWLNEIILSIWKPEELYKLITKSFIYNCCRFILNKYASWLLIFWLIYSLCRASVKLILKCSNLHCITLDSLLNLLRRFKF